MDGYSFLSNVIESLAWPLTVILVLFYFKDDTISMLSRLKKFKHRDTELEFVEGVRNLQEDREDATVNEDNLGGGYEYDENYLTLLNLAEISPRSAILESFRLLELKLASKYSELYGFDGSSSNVKFKNGKLKLKLLSEAERIEYSKLQELRNQAAHDPDFYVATAPVITYIDSTVALINKIEYKSN